MNSLLVPAIASTECQPLSNERAPKKRTYILRNQIPSEALPIDDARAVAESIIQVNEWFSDREGYCTCPGEGSHTTLSLPTDCKVVCAKLSDGCAPGLWCWHSSCEGVRAPVSYALQSALGKAQHGGGYSGERYEPRPMPAKAQPPEYDRAKIAKIASKLANVNAEWLAERSPVGLGEITLAGVLNVLYRPGEKVIIFDVYKSSGQLVWTCGGVSSDVGELNTFRRGKLCGAWFLAAPVTGEYVEDGKMNTDASPHLTRRSWRTVTAFRYLVLESDEADSSHWLSVLAQMPLPIAAITMSGGKSIHALVEINASSKEEWDARVALLKPAMITLGADRGAMSAVRLTRLPLCERLGSTNKAGEYTRFPEPRMQALLYLDAVPTGQPICERGEA
jgi:hypothetical protein